MIEFLLPFALMVTNGQNTNVTAPTNSLIGWQFVASNGPYTAIGPRLACSVQHVGGFVEPVFGGQLYHITKLIEPPASDMRFLVLDRDIVSGYAKLQTNFVFEQPCWVVAGGASYGQVVGDSYYWAGQDSKRLRWSYSGRVVMSSLARRYNWRFDACATADGDSGYACFSTNGLYIGPISGDAVNPKVLQNYGNSGEIILYYLDYIRDYLPPETNSPPKPKTPVGVSVEKH